MLPQGSGNRHLLDAPGPLRSGDINGKGERINIPNIFFGVMTFPCCLNAHLSPSPRCTCGSPRRVSHHGARLAEAARPAVQEDVTLAVTFLDGFLSPFFSLFSSVFHSPEPSCSSPPEQQMRG